MNHKEFVPSKGLATSSIPHKHENDFEDPKVENGSYQSSADFNPGFNSSFMPVQGPPGLFYPQYMQSYMPYGYPFMPGFRNGNYYDRKGHHDRKKHHGYSHTTKQIVYAQKPKQLPKEEQIKLEAQLENLTIEEKKSKEMPSVILLSIDGTSGVEKLPHKIEKAVFFVIKSYSEEDVFYAIRSNVWCSTKEGNVKLHNAYITANNEYPVYLLFSVNSSGYFVGAAQMKSPVDFDKNFGKWGQSHKWKGLFKISWIYIKDVPNKELRHLKNDLNDGKPVPNSRDCQEVPFEAGIKVLEIFEKYKHQTSILDDMEFYEMQEKTKV